MKKKEEEVDWKDDGRDEVAVEKKKEKKKGMTMKQ